MHRKIVLGIGSFALVLALTGCGPDKNQPTSKQLATREWNNARAQVLMGLATDQYKGGNFDKSRQTVNEALKLVPDSSALHILSAKLAIEAGQLELAEQELKLARQYAPNNGEAYYLSGVVYQRWQKPDTAYEFYRQAYSKAPAELAYLMAESEMLVAMDRMPEALQLLQAKVTYFEHSGTIRDAVGQMMMQAGKFADAVAMFREASILSETELAIRERLALALFADKEYRECSETLSRLLQNEAYNKRGDLFTMLGDCQLHLTNPRAARASFESATQFAPDSARAWQGLGSSALQCGDLRRAEMSLNHSLSLNRRDGESYLLLGYVRLRQGQVQSALASFQKASAADPSDTISMCMIGYALEKLGRSAEAMQFYSRALKIKPGDDMASQLLAGVDLHE
ncbi:MAG TPA: tetratricopeptide repeat protein [Tepidisphaeraceae bacterium]|nr:tetratricopeptide repeat protein [Tepidisphaeraceae bacterium]